MRRILTTVLFVMAVTPTMALAQSQKIGFVDIAYLVDKSPQAQAASAALEEDFGPRQNQLQQKKQEFQQLRQKFEQNSLVMSDSESQEQRKHLQQMARELQRGEKAFRDELNDQRNAALRQVHAAVLKAVKAVADEGGYDLIVGQGTVYASDAVNITARVLERMKARYESSSE